MNGENGESSINIYTLSCVKLIVGEKLLYNTGSPVWCSVMTQAVGWEERREAKEGEDISLYAYR